MSNRVSRLARHRRIIIKVVFIVLFILYIALFVGSIVTKDWSGALGILVVDSGILVILYIYLKTNPKDKKL